MKYIIGAGGIYNHIEIENKDGGNISDTGHGLGCEAEAGLVIPIGHHNSWQLIPTARYHSFSREISLDGINTPVDLNYFSIGLGVSWIIYKEQTAM